MKCTPIVDSNGNGLGFACGGGGRSRKTCATPGCGGRVARECDYPIQRPGRSVTCDRAMCLSCSHKIGISRNGDSVDYCRAHHAAWLEKEPYTFRDLAPAVREIMNLVGLGFVEVDPHETTHKLTMSPQAKPSPPGAIVLPASNTAPLVEVAVPLPLWRIQGIGARDKIIVASLFAHTLETLLGDRPRDWRTIVAISRAPIHFETAEPPHDWEIFIRMGAGVFPEQKEEPHERS